MSEPKITFEQDGSGRITVRATNEGVLLTKEEADRVAARVKELEARISDLARENAELKQVPHHVDASPRCPLRDSMTGEMGACEKSCMWLIGIPNKDGTMFKACAVAASFTGMRKILNNYGWVKEGE